MTTYVPYAYIRACSPQRYDHVRNLEEEEGAEEENRCYDKYSSDMLSEQYRVAIESSILAAGVDFRTSEQASKESAHSTTET